VLYDRSLFTVHLWSNLVGLDLSTDIICLATELSKCPSYKEVELKSFLASMDLTTLSKCCKNFLSLYFTLQNTVGLDTKLGIFCYYAKYYQCLIMS